MEFQQKNLTILFFVIFSYSVSILSAASSTEYTDKEIAALKQFRELIPDIIAQDEYYQTDSFLIRWIRAKKFDLDSANKMIHEANKWRNESGVELTVNETLLEFPSPPYVFQGTDKEGRPLLLLTPTTIDFRGLLQSGKRDLVLNIWDQLLERGFQYIKSNKAGLIDGGEVTQIVGILDGKGFNLGQHACLQCVPVYIEMLRHLENYYPAALKYFVVINTHPLALPLTELLRPFLSESTQRSLKVFGSTKQEWHAFLKTIIDEDELPYRFGGTKSAR